MALNMTPHLEDLLGNHFETGGLQLTQPTLLVALLTGDMTVQANIEDATTWAEVPTAGSSGYLRVLVGNWTATAGVLTNDAAITFPPAANVNWGTVTGIALTTEANEATALTSVIGGNSWFAGKLAQSQPINVGDTFRFIAGALSVSFG